MLKIVPPENVRQDVVVFPIELANAVLSYLGQQPYTVVAGLIEEIRTKTGFVNEVPAAGPEAAPEETTTEA